MIRMFTLKLFSASALYQFGSSSKKVVSICNPSTNFNRAQLEYVKIHFILVAVFERTLVAVTRWHIPLYYTNLSGFPILSSSKHILLHVAMNLFARIFPYIGTPAFMVIIVFLLSTCITSGLLLSTVCENALIRYNWMLISIQ